MAKCKYCGNSAGFFSRSHKECKEKHERGLMGLRNMLQRYFEGGITATKVGANILQNKAPYFLKDEDIANISSEVVDGFTTKLQRPYNPHLLTLISEYIQNIGISYSLLNANGAMDRLGQKVMYGFLIDYFAQGVSINQANNNALAVTNIIPLSYEKKNKVYMNVLNKAASKFMKDGYMTDAEEKLITSYSQNLGLSLNNLPTDYSNTDLEKIGQAIVLKDLEKGIFPKQTSTSVPVLLSKGECPLWVYHNVTMLQEKIQREYRGRSGGFSFRVCKGVTYRTGQFRGHPVERSYMDTIGTGSLVVTNKNLFFHCNTASAKIPFAKLIGITPYSDGIEVHKEEAKPKRIVFQGFDSWFILNVLSHVNNI